MRYVEIIERTASGAPDQDAKVASKPRGRASRMPAAAADQGLMPITVRGRVTAANPRE
jgi:hypothetical protein